MATFLLPACCFVAVDSRRTAGNQQGNSKETASGAQKSVGSVARKNDKKEEHAGSADD